VNETTTTADIFNNDPLAAALPLVLNASAKTSLTYCLEDIDDVYTVD
jgi:hypothetical protein